MASLHFRNWIFLIVLVLPACAATPAAPIGTHQGAPARTEDEQELWEDVGQLTREISRQGLIYDDPNLSAYVNNVGKKIVPQSAQEKMSFQFFIYRDPRPNAFALPNGRIYIHMGLLSALENEDQLAFVLAHETTHVVNRHTLQHVRNLKAKTVAAKITSIMVTPVIGAYGGSGLANLFNLGLSLTYAAAVSGYNRELEEEADRQGLQLVSQAGYNPQEAPHLFEVLLAEREDAGAVATFFYGSHPASAERLRYTRDLLQTQFSSVPAGTEESNSEQFNKQTLRVRLDTAILNNRSDRYRHAITGLQKVLTQDPGNAEAYYQLGESHRLTANHPERSLAEEAQKQRRTPKAEERLSNPEIEEEVRQSIAAYTKSIQQDAQYAAPHKGLGLLYRQQSSYKLAAQEFTTYLQLNPGAQDTETIKQYTGEIHQ